MSVTNEQRAAWRLQAELAVTYGAPATLSHQRILALLDALDAAEQAERTGADIFRAALNRAERAEAVVRRVEALADEWGESRAPTAATELRATLNGA